MKIVDLMIDDVNSMLADRKLHIDVPGDVEEKLVELGYNPKMGARPLRRVIQEQIEDRIADYVLDNSNAHDLVAKMDGDQITVAAKDASPVSSNTENVD